MKVRGLYLAALSIGLGVLCVLCFMGDGEQQRPSITPEPSRSSKTETSLIDSAFGPKATRQASTPVSGRTTTVVTVEDDAGQAIPGASVFMADAVGAVAEGLAITDGRGICTLKGLPLEFDRVFLRASGFASRFAGIPADRSSFTVVLDPGYELVGLVVDPHGNTLGPEILVFAWPASGDSQGKKEVVRAFAGDPSQAITATDDAGRFSFAGLHSGVAYLMVAAGKGVLTRDYSQVVPGPSQSPVRLVASWGFATLIKVRDLKGEPVLAFGPHVASRKFRSSTESPEAQPCIAVGPCLELLGMAGLESSSGRLVLYSTSDQVTQVAPNRAFIGLPGYQPEEVDFASDSLMHGANEVTIALTPDAEGFADLLVEFVPMSGATLDTVIAGTLVLTSAERPAISIYVESGAERVRKFAHLPEGQYGCHFYAEGNPLRIPAQGELDLKLSARHGALSMSMPATGGITLQVVDASGAYGGPLDLDLSFGQPEIVTETRVFHGTEIKPGSVMYGMATHQHFAKPPYDIVGLVPGRYTVDLDRGSARGASRLVWPDGLPELSGVPAVLDVTVGSPVLCEFVLH